MRRFRTLSSKIAPVILLGIVWLTSARAKAEITLFDRDGWTFQTTGLVAAHYQLLMGDKDPQGGNKTLIGGKIYDEGITGNQETGKITLSDIRSGFIGTQIGFGLSRQISPTVHVDSLLAASVNGINDNRGQDIASPKGVDYREAWAQVVTPYGSVKFGRMFGLFGSSSAAVQMMAWQFGVGHPCVIDASTIACGSSGAGPLYPGFDAAIRYISPRIFGFELQVSVTDPDVGNPPVGKISPYPRVDAELNYDQTFGGARVRLFGQSMWNRVASSTPTTETAYTIWGVMGTGLLDIGPVSLGGGGWTGAGVGERIPLEEANPSNPIAWDNLGNLRHFLGVYGNAQFNFQGTAITVGGGDLIVKPTAYDLDPTMNSSELVLKDQYEGHIVVTHRFGDVIVLNVEYMHWHTDWQPDPDPTVSGVQGYSPFAQSLNFMGAGLNYVW